MAPAAIDNKINRRKIKVDDRNYKKLFQKTETAGGYTYYLVAKIWAVWAGHLKSARS